MGADCCLKAVSPLSSPTLPLSPFPTSSAFYHIWESSWLGNLDCWKNTRALSPCRRPPLGYSSANCVWHLCLSSSERIHSPSGTGLGPEGVVGAGETSGCPEVFGRSKGADCRGCGGRGDWKNCSGWMGGTRTGDPRS